MLGRAALFADLDEADLSEVNGRCHVSGFGAGEPIYHAGTPADRLFVVASGAVKTVRLAPDGRETVLELCGPGDAFGAVPALGEEHHADSAWTLTPTCVLWLNAAEYGRIMEEFPPVAMATVAELARRLDESHHNVHLLAGASLARRLAAMLSVLADKVGRPWEGGTLIDVPLVRDDVASMVGAATESVSRLLSTWKRDGVIDSGRGWIAILDTTALEAVRDGRER